jgi:hypothetical protein
MALRVAKGGARGRKESYVFIQRTILLWMLMFIFCGCARCVVMRSEYFDVTGKVFAPRPADADVPLLTAEPVRDYERIRTVRAWARYDTNPEAIREELKRRARVAGADALMNVYIGEDEKADILFCGKVFTTKRNISGRASAIVYTDEETASSPADQARNPALYNL